MNEYTQEFIRNIKTFRRETRAEIINWLIEQADARHAKHVRRLEDLKHDAPEAICCGSER